MAGWGKWTTVRAFGNVSYFNISYLVLFLVPMLHDLHQSAAPIMAWMGPATFPPTLKWLFAASLLFAIAIAVYQYRCPPEIKRFGSDEDEFIRKQHEILVRALPSQRSNIVLAHLDPDLDKRERDKLLSLMREARTATASRAEEIQEEIEALVGRLHPDAVQRFLLRKYSALNECRPLSRWASFVLYLSGTAILLALLAIRSASVFS